MIFETVYLDFDGKTYTVPPEKVLKLIAVIERHIRIADLVNPSGAPLSALSHAYSDALKFAGCQNVEPEQIYLSLYEEGAREKIENAIVSLMHIMIPPERLKTFEDKGDSEGKEKPPTDPADS